ncbi:MAG: hypothetical protein K0R75_1079 [Paenibacillaceae bacterium]|nr:hypothetical protein [Paenibacillaceae bacterium]
MADKQTSRMKVRPAATRKKGNKPKNKIKEPRSTKKTITPHFVNVRKTTPVKSYIPPKRNLRILFTIDQLNVGGTETYALTLIRVLLKRGDHVVVAAKEGKLLDSFRALGCPVYDIDFVTQPMNASKIKEVHEQLKAILIQENIQLVHCHQTPSARLTIPAASQLGIPAIFTVHGTYVDKLFIENYMKKCASVICVSPILKKNLQGLSIPVHVIPNGIDMVEYDRLTPLFTKDLRRQLKIPDHASVIVYAGRLAWEKSDICKQVISACQILKESSDHPLHLVIKGDGIDYKHIYNLVEKINKKSGESFIHLLDFYNNMRSIYSMADCIIGTGRVAVESLACMRPVVAVGSRGYLGIVGKHSYEAAWNTWFADHSALANWSVKQLVTDIRQTLQTPQEIQEENAWLGRKWVNDNFGIKRVRDKILDVYHSALENIQTVNHN